MASACIAYRTFISFCTCIMYVKAGLNLRGPGNHTLNIDPAKSVVSADERA